MGTRGLQLTNWGEELEFERRVYCLVKFDGNEKHHKTTLVNLSKFADFKRSKPYSFRLNGKSQLRQGALIEVQLHMGRGKYNDDHVMLSSWTQRANDLLSAATKAGAVTGFFDIKPSHRFLITTGARLELNLELLQSDNKYEKDKKQRCAKELRRIIDEFVALQGVLPDAMVGDDMINISIPYCRDLSLLHAAVNVGDEKLVSKLLKLGADPTVHSEDGTPLEIAEKLFQSENSDATAPIMHNIYEQLKDAICHEEVHSL